MNRDFAPELDVIVSEENNYVTGERKDTREELIAEILAWVREPKVLNTGYGQAIDTPQDIAIAPALTKSK